MSASRVRDECRRGGAYLRGEPLRPPPGRSTVARPTPSAATVLEAWLDQVVLVGRNAVAEDSPTKGMPAYVVAGRGGSYARGTPREGYEYVQNHLRAILGDMLGLDIDFVVPEFTLAHSSPAMAELIPLAEASKARAHEDVRSKGKAAALNAA
ncbi:hypothetical protein ACSCB1_03805 [Streptomyces europaeiscabiei]|uniref:hypothetical protein n=1 Tax=Streptomyces europaeiscabiei TaxID=146819 RepID=UPI000765CE39